MGPNGRALTISTAITFFNTYFYIFNEISWWLEENSRTTWKEDHRALKAVRSYVVRNKHHGKAKLPQHIHIKIVQLRQRKTQWMKAPGAYEAEQEAMVDAQCQPAGYIAGFESDDDTFTFEGHEYEERYQENYQDNYQENYQESYQGGYQDDYQGDYQNGYQGDYQSDSQDGCDDVYDDVYDDEGEGDE